MSDVNDILGSDSEDERLRQVLAKAKGGQDSDTDSDLSFHEEPHQTPPAPVVAKKSPAVTTPAPSKAPQSPAGGVQAKKAVAPSPQPPPNAETGPKKQVAPPPSQPTEGGAAKTPQQQPQPSTTRQSPSPQSGNNAIRPGSPAGNKTTAAPGTQPPQQTTTTSSPQPNSPAVVPAKKVQQQPPQPIQPGQNSPAAPASPGPASPRKQPPNPSPNPQAKQLPSQPQGAAPTTTTATQPTPKQEQAPPVSKPVIAEPKPILNTVPEKPKTDVLEYHGSTSNSSAQSTPQSAPQPPVVSRPKSPLDLPPPFVPRVTPKPNPPPPPPSQPIPQPTIDTKSTESIDDARRKENVTQLVRKDEGKQQQQIVSNPQQSQRPAAKPAGKSLPRGTSGGSGGDGYSTRYQQAQQASQPLRPWVLNPPSGIEDVDLMSSPSPQQPPHKSQSVSRTPQVHQDPSDPVHSILAQAQDRLQQRSESRTDPHSAMAIASAASSISKGLETSMRDRLASENKRLTQELTQLHNDLAELRTHLENQNSTRISIAREAQWQIQMQENQTEITTLRQQCEEVTSSSSRLKAQFDSTARELRGVKDQLISAQSHSESLEMRLQEREAALASEAATCARIRVELREKISELTRVKAEFDAQRRDDERRLQEATSLVEEAQRQRIHFMEASDKFERERNDLLTGRQKLIDENRALQTELQRLKTGHLEELEKTKSQVKQLVSEKSDLENTLQGAMQTLQRLNQSDDALQEDNRALQEKLVTTMAQLHNVQQVADKSEHLQQQVVELNEENERLTNECTRLAMIRQETSKECEKLRQEMKEMHRLVMMSSNTTNKGYHASAFSK
eukprot:PhF_6_TR10805/c0_g1_i1/m.17396